MLMKQTIIEVKQPTKKAIVVHKYPRVDSTAKKMMKAIIIQKTPMYLYSLIIKV